MPQLSRILQTQLIPWSAPGVQQRFVVTHKAMRPGEMPDGVQLSPRPILGKRVIVKNQRLYKNSRHIAAHWPDSGLIEVPKYKLMCVLQGHIRYPVGEHFLSCGPNHFIFLPPGLPHSDGLEPYADTSKSSSCSVLFLLLHPSAIQLWVTHRDENPLQVGENVLILNLRARSLFEHLMEEIYGDEEALVAAQEGLLTALLSILERELRLGRIVRMRDNPRRATFESLDDLQRNNFRRGLEHYIGANLHRRVTINEAAQSLFLSRAQFTRTVRRETGMSFNEFLTARRLVEAKVLLRDSQWTISAIASFVGFTSASYFRTFFRNHTGKTPSEFRRSTQNKEA